MERNELSDTCICLPLLRRCLHPYLQVVQIDLMHPLFARSRYYFDGDDMLLCTVRTGHTLYITYDTATRDASMFARRGILALQALYTFWMLISFQSKASQKLFESSSYRTIQKT